MIEHLNGEDEGQNAKDVWVQSFKYADQLAGIFNEIVRDNVKSNEVLDTIEMQIAHTNALFILACFVNQEVIETDLLDRAFNACKDAVKGFVSANHNGGLNS